MVRRKPVLAAHWIGLAVPLVVGQIIFLLHPERQLVYHARLCGVIGLWMLVMQCVDIFWVVRPTVFFGEGAAGQLHLSWVDFAGVLGPVLLFFGLLLRRVGSVPLVCLKDPRLAEADT